MSSRIKHCSWPPLRESKRINPGNEIDENPFAYFVTPAEELQDFDGNDLAAGIDNKPRSRSLSPFHRDRPHTIAATSTRESAAAKLKRWIERLQLRYFHPFDIRPPPRRSPPHTPVSSEPSKLAIPSSPTSSPRDRAEEFSRHRSARPRAWREPSEDIWPVIEEREDAGASIIVA
ncbi:hypothetical protein MMC12_000136 [Toensbergia leucococca]|nr:hypothetical protein [Toensbergia leucococca]